MKKALINTINDLMYENKNIYMFTADLGYGVMNKIVENHPERFINVGICEQNMTSMAAGMAMEGNIVFTYSIGNFPTLRCLEQIRNDVAYHHANVKIVAVGGGFAYGNLGMSHHATEDIAVMRAIPGMTVFSPADAAETTAVIKEAVKIDGPVYIRLGRGGESDITHISFDINRIMPVAKKEVQCAKYSVALLGTGTVVADAAKAVEQLGECFDVSVYSVTKIKPLDIESVIKICKENDYVATIEEHNVAGGVGSAIAEIISEAGIGIRLLRIGMDDQFTQVVGSPNYLRHYYELDCEGIVRRVRSLLEVDNG